MNGSGLPLFQKPGFYGETVYNHKSCYSLNCQLVMMPHNLLIVDYAMGHPGSAHDAYAFQSTRIAKEHATLLCDDEWLWANSAYSSAKWSVVPFKKPKHGRLLRNERTFNYYLSKVFFFVSYFLKTYIV
ncbi:hypothetical protein HYDPIDRAFT_101295 [Hydnomerulius pinastri MD-312]|uniref:DDE Tnp4 domain-containing protein n=1 Tax=Hydnomerulius pinastri MD-312 TaxID=994086 RepID=A0A0C9V1L2_9AGAM|nr:hypothetical protein HYDPIDRAFT_101295 [Hydnomerulius pinastri MD-312]